MKALLLLSSTGGREIEGSLIVPSEGVVVLGKVVTSLLEVSRPHILTLDASLTQRNIQFYEDRVNGK